MIIDELFESPQQCPECGGISFSDLILAEKKDACYHKVKASAKVWPSAYASGRLVQCRKKGAANYGNKSEGVAETVATPPAPAQDPSQPYLDKLGARAGVAPGSNITQVTDAYQQKLLDRMGKRFGLPPGSTMDQVQAAQQAYLNKNDPTAAAQYKQNMTNIDAGNTAANKPVQLAPKPAPARPVAENTAPQLSVQQLATISDEALDNAYGYGRSTPGNTFGWQANLKSAAYAKQMIDQGVTDIEAISDAIHKGWNTTAQAFVQDPEQFDDTAKLAAAGKLEAKLQQRAQLMKQNYAQLPEEEKEKDRVVARALLQAIRGEQGVAEAELDEKSVSQAQFRTMAGAAHNPEFARKVGISQDVAQEFNQADKKSNYKKLPARATEGEQQKGADYRDPREVDYDDAYDSMVARVKKLAGLGAMKTVYDPARRQYRNMPTAQQPKK